MTTDTNAIISDCHTVYCRLSGMQPNQMVWEHYWLTFIQTGYTRDDLEAVLIWLIRENKRFEKRYQRSMNLHKLISDLCVFDSMLCEAKASNRNFKPLTAKERALRDLRPGASETNGNGRVRHVSEIIKVPANLNQ